MEILWLLLKASWRGMAAAIGMGLISGASSAAIADMLWPFVGLAIVSLISGLGSQFTLIQLAQNSVHDRCSLYVLRPNSPAGVA